MLSTSWWLISVTILELRCDLDLLDKAGNHHCICCSSTPDLKIVIVIVIIIFLRPHISNTWSEKIQGTAAGISWRRKNTMIFRNRNMMPIMMVMVVIKMKMMKIVYLTFNTEMIMSTQYSAGARSSLAGSLQQDHDDDHGHHDHYLGSWSSWSYCDHRLDHLW